jgi:hypothetical protein
VKLPLTPALSQRERGPTEVSAFYIDLKTELIMDSADNWIQHVGVILEYPPSVPSPSGRGLG